MRNHFGIKLSGWDKKQGHDLVWKKESNDQDGGDLMDFKKHAKGWIPLKSFVTRILKVETLE